MLLDLLFLYVPQKKIVEVLVGIDTH
jgi:hypothetical protein